MKVLFGLSAAVILVCLLLTTRVVRAPDTQPCSQAWLTYLDERYYSVTDGQGHGPDTGSSEWMNAFEFKMKLPDTSGHSQADRCHAMQAELQQRTYLINKRFGLMTSF